MKFKNKELNFIINSIILIMVFIMVGCFNTSLTDRTPPNLLTRNILIDDNNILINEDFMFDLELYVQDLRGNIVTLTVDVLLQSPGDEGFNAVINLTHNINSKEYNNVLELTILSEYFDIVGEYNFKVYIGTVDDSENIGTFST